MSLMLAADSALLVDEFLAGEKPKVTQSGYVSLAGYTRQALRWFDDEEREVLDTTIVDATHFAAWITEFRMANGQPYATGTVLLYLNAMRRFFDFLVRTERMRTNPFRELRRPRTPEHLSRNILSEAQMGRLLNELAHFDRLPAIHDRRRRYRAHVLAEFLYATGLRINEAASLAWENFDLAHRLAYLPRGKNGNPRMVFLTAYATQVLEHYVREGRAAIMVARVNTGAFFGAGTHNMEMLLHQELRTVCASLGLPVITCHGFRHSLGTHLLRAGCDLRHIQVILGHESLNATQVYTRVDKDDLKHSLDTFHPRRFREKQTSTATPLEE